MTPFEFAPEFVFDSACSQKRLALIPGCVSLISRDPRLSGQEAFLGSAPQ
jgi:hypothetical protein